MEFKFKQGETLRDKVTGFQGVVMARTDYFTGCVHCGLCSRTLKDGKPIEWEWFDETRLILVSDIEKVLREPGQATDVGGMFPNAPKM